MKLELFVLNKRDLLYQIELLTKTLYFIFIIF